MRGHFAVGLQMLEVGNREERGGRSAWTLCSGLAKVGRREERAEGSARMARSGEP